MYKTFLLALYQSSQLSNLCNNIKHCCALCLKDATIKQRAWNWQNLYKLLEVAWSIMLSTCLIKSEQEQMLSLSSIVHISRGTSGSHWASLYKWCPTDIWWYATKHINITASMKLQLVSWQFLYTYDCCSMILLHIIQLLIKLCMVSRFSWLAIAVSFMKECSQLSARLYIAI